MSSIGGISGASSAGSYFSVSRSQMREKAFAKVDADGSGSVDTTELQGMLDDITKKTGQSLGSADDLLATMDSDGSGSLSSDELDTGMKSLMPPPSSTVQFAQDRGAEGGPGGCDMPPPPPPDGAGADGLMQSLMKLGDTDQDGTLSTDEAQTLKDSLTAAVDSALKSLSSSSDSSSTASTASTSGSSATSTSTASTTSDTDSLSKAAAALIEKMTSMLLRRYGSDEASSTSSGLSVAA
jgi:Ca2+-binding EF-hand superfamily protein